MKNVTLTILLLAICLVASAQETQRPVYLEIHKDIAIQEMNRSGIPASIILAQAIVESAWGKATLAQAANNHFGIKCKSDWMGPSYQLEDDDYDSDGNLIRSCFRAYPDVLSSFRDHTNFLVDGQRYQVLFTYEKADYTSWAHGLKACGYATDPAYAEKLIKKIEDYRLYEFDQPAEEVVMDAPSFQIPSNAVVSDPEITEERVPTSFVIEENFGLIEITPVSYQVPVNVEPILEMPTYSIPTEIVGKD